MSGNDKDLNFDKRDEFRRKPIAQNLIKILGSDVPISTIVIDGPWGSGKTEFCQKFLNLSDADNAPFTCVYIDAFKYDHADDPLAMLISAIASVVPNANQKNDLLKKAIPVVKVLGKAAGKVAIGLVLQTNADKLGDQITDAIAESSEEALDEGIKRVLENYEQAEETLKVFKEALSRSAAGKKIVVIVDELDRCRPDFSLAILEKIKHVFDVKNVRFVLSTNVKQLEAVVKKQYGSDLDAESYLSKFFSYTLHLPQDHSHNSYDYNQNSFQLFASLVRLDSNLKSQISFRRALECQRSF